MGDLDLLYMTRVQKERFFDEDEFDRLKDSFILTTEKMELAKSNMRILHPLPRVNEITQEIDDDPRAAYFRQVEYGKFVRMALICKLIDWSEDKVNYAQPIVESPEDLRCHNRRCITATEDVPHDLHQDEQGEWRCRYCESRAH